VFGYEHFSLSVSDVIYMYGQIDFGCSMSESLTTYRAASLFELLMIRQGILAVRADFTRRYFDDFIRTVCKDRCRYFLT